MRLCVALWRRAAGLASSQQLTSASDGCPRNLGVWSEHNRTGISAGSTRTEKIALLRRKRTKHGSRLQTDEKKDWEPSTKIRPRTKRRTKSLLGLAHEPTRPSDRRNSMFAANTVDEGSALASHPAAHARRPTPPPSAEATTTGRSPRTPPSAPHTRGSAFRGLTDGASAAAASAAAAAFARMPAAAFALPAAVATLAARRSAAAATEAAAAACRRSCC